MERRWKPAVVRLLLVKRTDAKGESDSRIMGVMYRDGVICDDLLIREVQDVLIKMGYPHAEVSSEGPGAC